MSTTCRVKECGRVIVWGVDEKGTRIPLDPQALVYRIKNFTGDTANIERAADCCVAHFAVCAAPQRFSKKQKTEMRVALDRARGGKDA